MKPNNKLYERLWNFSFYSWSNKVSSAPWCHFPQTKNDELKRWPLLVGACDRSSCNDMKDPILHLAPQVIFKTTLQLNRRFASSYFLHLTGCVSVTLVKIYAVSQALVFRLPKRRRTEPRSFAPMFCNPFPMNLARIPCPSWTYWQPTSKCKQQKVIAYLRCTHGSKNRITLFLGFENERRWSNG